jgi:hypothetical protein
VRRVQAIVLDLADIEDSALVIWQKIHAGAGSAYFRPASCLPLSNAAKLRTGAAIRNV